MTLDARAIATRTAAALWLATTLFLTLGAVAQPTPVPFWGFFTETMAGVDYVQNIVLFLPLGWIANRGRWRWWHTVLAGVLVSGSIEFLQQWVPGRTSQASDIVCNTVGVAFGWWMASPAVRPRARLGAAFAALAAFMGLHVLNTAWPESADRAGGAGVWEQVGRVACPVEARAHTVCLTVPNTAEGGNKYVRVVGPGDRTYARAQSDAHGRLMTMRDCVILMFESTVGARLRLRPPLRAVCALVDSTDRAVTLLVDPRLEHVTGGEWTPTRASEWMWPAWPFTAYQPMRLVTAGAIAFIVIASLMSGAASWVIPAGYLVMLEIVALLAAMRAPGWQELGWTVVGWLAGAALLRLDRWWRPPRL